MAETILDMYRIGVVGPSDAGKSMLLSGLSKTTVLECPLCSGRLSPARGVASAPSAEDSVHDASHHATDVYSVVVKDKGPLGIKIAKHKKYMGFVCVKAFVRDTSTGDMLVLERSGKVCPGDLLVAVNRQNLLNMPQQEITNILKNDSEIRVLTFLRNASPSQCRGVDVSAPATLGTDGVVVNVEQACSCSTWRTYTTIDDRPCCLEIVEISGQDSSLSLLRSHLSGLDGILLVYSLEMMSSLLMLEKRYARALPGMLSAQVNIKGIDDFPLVVVGTTRCGEVSDYSPIDPAAGRRNQENQQQLLLKEGNAFAEVWGAAPVIVANVGEEPDNSDKLPSVLNEIVQTIVRRIDAIDDSSCFVDNSAASRLGLSYYLPMCFVDCAFGDPDISVDTSIDGEEDTPRSTTESKVVASKKDLRARRRKDARKLRRYAGVGGNMVSHRALANVGTPDHPSEDLPFGATSSKLLRFVLSSCE